MHSVQDRVTDGTADGRRERKKRETYHRLVTAARQLGLARGADAVTVEDIAERADVSVRTFFNYFASKDDAMVGLEPGTCERLHADLLARPRRESPLRSLHAVLVPSDVEAAAYRWGLRAELVRRSPALLPHHLAALAQIEHALATALAERLQLADDDRTARVVVGAVMGAVSAVLADRDGDGDVDLGDAIDTAFAVLRKGLR